jgi:hypothetical protein
MSSFKPENIFFLSGHGTEKLGKRYQLEENQYAGIALMPGELGTILYHKNIYDVIFNKYLKISIPRKDREQTGDLGLSSRFGAKDVKKKDQATIERIEHFKIYRPKMGFFDFQRYWYTIPNLIYFPTADFPTQKKFAKVVTEGTYKGVKYKDLGVIDIAISGILRADYEGDTSFVIDDIEDYHIAYPKDEKPDRIPLGVPSSTSQIITVHHPTNILEKKIGIIKKDKKSDPLGYDLYCWLKAAYKASVVPLQDILLINVLHEFKAFDSSRTFVDNFKAVRRTATKKEIEEQIDKLPLYYITETSLYMDLVFPLIEEIVKPEGPYIVIPLICREVEGSTSRSILRERIQSRKGLTRKLKKRFLSRREGSKAKTRKNN